MVNTSKKITDSDIKQAKEAVACIDHKATRIAIGLYLNMWFKQTASKEGE